MDGGWCSMCDQDAVRPASLLPRLRSWFVQGTGLRSLRICAACGASSSGGLFYRRVTRWSRPFLVVHNVRFSRTWHPVPVFYAVVAAAGAAVALCVALAAKASNRGRWAAGGAVAAVVVTFVLSVGTVFRGGGARRKLLMALGSRRGLALELRLTSDPEPLLEAKRQRDGGLGSRKPG